MSRYGFLIKLEDFFIDVKNVWYSRIMEKEEVEELGM
jgi:hypothetical protein